MLKHEARLAPELLYDKKRGVVLRLYTMTAAKEVLVHPADLRARYCISLEGAIWTYWWCS